MSRSTLMASFVFAAFITAAASHRPLAADNSAARIEVPKVETQGVWQPTADGEQVSLLARKCRSLQNPIAAITPKRPVMVRRLSGAKNGIGRVTSRGPR